MGIIPVREINSAELGDRLCELTAENQEYLQKRHKIGTLSRYLGATSAEASGAVDRLKQLAEQKTMFTYAAVGLDEKIEGVATIYPNIGLRRLRMPIAPKFAAKLSLAQTIDMLGPNIDAWADETRPDLLRFTYSALVHRTQHSGEMAERGRAWTIEPAQDTPFMHSVIRTAGLMPVSTARYDDLESGRHVPPVSTLYQLPLAHAT